MSAKREAKLIGWLRAAERVLAFCGAGVSAESGVPTFRGAGGLWEGHRVEDVATPEAFERDPLLVWRFYAARQKALQEVEPNPAHRVLAAMDAHFPEFLLVSQNVDNLHERAGSERLVKLHGSLMETRCTECERVTPCDPLPEAELDAGRLPHCRCGGLLRPNVVWFGEYLLAEHLRALEAFFERAAPDGKASPPVVLIIGTSGSVSGGYGLTQAARRSGARLVEINPAPSLLSREVDLPLREPAGVLLARIWPEVTREQR